MSRTLSLCYNDLTSLPAGVFDALTALKYVGEGESARVGACGDACCRHTCARAAADMRHACARGGTRAQALVVHTLNRGYGS